MPDALHIDDLELARREIDRLREELRDALADAASAKDDAREKIQEFAREFRVPLTAVLGFSDILSAKDTGNTAEWNQIAIAGHQLMELIQNLEQPTWQAFPSNNQADESTATAPAPPGIRTLLHIEDNELNFRLAKRILEDRPDIQVLWAPTGAEGVDLATKSAPTVILLDLNLPDIHGSDVLVQLRKNPATEKTPVIVLSADNSPTRIERMLQAGARNYLVKPFEIQRFLFLVDEALRSQEQVAA